MELKGVCVFVCVCVCVLLELQVFCLCNIFCPTSEHFLSSLTFGL